MALADLAPNLSETPLGSAARAIWSAQPGTVPGYEALAQPWLSNKERVNLFAKDLEQKDTATARAQNVAGSGSSALVGGGLLGVGAGAAYDALITRGVGARWGRAVQKRDAEALERLLDASANYRLNQGYDDVANSYLKNPVGNAAREAAEKADEIAKNGPKIKFEALNNFVKKLESRGYDVRALNPNLSGVGAQEGGRALVPPASAVPKAGLSFEMLYQRAQAQARAKGIDYGSFSKQMAGAAADAAAETAGIAADANITNNPLASGLNLEGARVRERFFNPSWKPSIVKGKVFDGAEAVTGKLGIVFPSKWLREIPISLQQGNPKIRNALIGLGAVGASALAVKEAIEENKDTRQMLREFRKGNTSPIEDRLRRYDSARMASMANKTLPDSVGVLQKSLTPYLNAAEIVDPAVGNFISRAQGESVFARPPSFG